MCLCGDREVNLLYSLAFLSSLRVSGVHLCSSHILSATKVIYYLLYSLFVL